MLQGMEAYCTASWLQQSCLKTSLVPQTLGSQAWRRHTEALNVIPSKQGSNAGFKAELLVFLANDSARSLGWRLVPSGLNGEEHAWQQPS